jgi:dGTPase
VAETGAALARSPFRVDRDRIVASPFFARLAGVTQVVSPTGSGLLVHNRLTHSLQVAQVGRAIAERLTGDPATAAVLDRLGGCDADVVEAAALAHDLGHPPFGHLGEQVLDRLGREKLGLPDGFEGNAQSFRIVTTIDLHGPGGTGLDLTAAVRAAAARRRTVVVRAGRGLGQVLGVLHGAGRPAGEPRGVRRAHRAVAADRGGGRDGHR